MKEIIRKYIINLISSTFGFIPIIEVVEEMNVFTIELDGSAHERSMMMGKMAQNFRSIKNLIKIFAKRNNIEAFIYIKSGVNKTN